MSNTLISKTIDAVEIYSNSNLTLETNTQIQFNTQQLLVNFIPIDQFIKHIVFEESFTTFNRDSANESNNYTSSSINLTDPYNNNATLTVDSVCCANVSANNSKVEIDDQSKFHCITFSTSNHLILNNTSDYNNIEYNQTDQPVSSLSNYIYHVLNETTFTVNDLDPNVSNGAIDVSNFGTYFTNKIITSNVTTSNVCDGSGRMEPILDISSYSAVNLHIYQDGATDTDALRSIASNIILGDNETNLKDYIYSFLDETVLYTLTISGTGHPGVEITLNNIVFQRRFDGNMLSPFTNDPFTYDIVFKIYEYSSEEPNPFGSAVSPITGIDPSEPNVRANPSFFPPTTSFTFDNLTPGTFYSIYADITNNVTNTVVNNIEVASNIPTIPFNEIVSVEILSEKKVRTTFSRHNVTTSTPVTVEFDNSVSQNGDNYVYTTRIQDLSSSIRDNFQYEYVLNGIILELHKYLIVKIRNSYGMEAENSHTNGTLTPAVLSSFFQIPPQPTLSFTSTLLKVTKGTSNNPPETEMTYRIYKKDTDTYTFTEMYMYTSSNASTDDNISYAGISSYDPMTHSDFLVGTWYVSVTNPYDMSNSSVETSISPPSVTISVSMGSSQPRRVEVTLDNVFSLRIINAQMQDGTLITTIPSTPITTSSFVLEFEYAEDESGGYKRFEANVVDSIDVEANIQDTYDLDINFENTYSSTSIDINYDPSQRNVIGENILTIGRSTYTYAWSSEDSVYREGIGTSWRDFEGFLDVSLNPNYSAITSDVVLNYSRILELNQVRYKCVVTETNQYGFKKDFTSTKTLVPPEANMLFDNVTANSITTRIEIENLYKGSGQYINSFTSLDLYYQDTAPTGGAAGRKDSNNYASNISISVLPNTLSYTQTINYLNDDTRYYFLLTSSHITHDNSNTPNQINETRDTITSTLVPSRPIINTVTADSSNPTILSVSWNDWGSDGKIVNAGDMKKYILYRKDSPPVPRPDLWNYHYSTFEEYESLFQNNGISYQAFDGSGSSTDITSLEADTKYYVRIIKVYIKFGYIIHQSDTVDQFTSQPFAQVTIDRLGISQLTINYSGYADTSQTFTYEWVCNNIVNEGGGFEYDLWGFVDSSFNLQQTLSVAAVDLIDYPSNVNPPSSTYDNVRYTCRVVERNSLLGSGYNTTNVSYDITWSSESSQTHPVGAREADTESVLDNNSMNGIQYVYRWWLSTPTSSYTYKWHIDNNGSIPERYNINYSIEIDTGSGFVQDTTADISVDTMSGNIITANVELVVPNTPGSTITFKTRLVKHMTLKIGEESENLLNEYNLNSTWVPETTFDVYDEFYPTIANAVDIVDNTLLSDEISFVWYKNNSTISSYKLYILDMITFFEVHTSVPNYPGPDFFNGWDYTEIELFENEGDPQADGGFKKTINGLRPGWDYVLWIEGVTKFIIRRTQGAQTPFYDYLTRSNPNNPSSKWDFDSMGLTEAASNLDWYLALHESIIRGVSFDHNTNNTILDDQFLTLAKEQLDTSIKIQHTYDSMYFWREGLLDDPASWGIYLSRKSNLPPPDLQYPYYYPYYNVVSRQVDVLNLNGYPYSAVDTNVVATNLDALGAEMKIPIIEPFTSTVITLWKRYLP